MGRRSCCGKSLSLGFLSVGRGSVVLPNQLPRGGMGGVQNGGPSQNLTMRFQTKKGGNFPRAGKKRGICESEIGVERQGEEKNS